MTTLCFAALALLAIVSSAQNSASDRPCDIYGASGAPCVAAHSTTRALYSAYNGPLYQVTEQFSKRTLDIPTDRDGYASSTTQDEFCAETSCVITRIYDQSPKGNHLNPGPSGGAARRPDKGVNASRHAVSVGGHKVYGALFEGGEGYRVDNTSGVATGDEAESMYMVTAGKHYNGGCCFDYGNAETNNDDDGAGTMEAIYWGNCKGWGSGQGDGPWVMGDMENGLISGNTTKTNPDLPSIDATFVTAMLKGDSGNHFALKGGDAQSGPLKTLYDGPRPARYHPMKKQGAIILGIGGDNSDSAIGTFYEGVMTQGFTSQAADDLVQANILAAGYKM